MPLLLGALGEERWELAAICLLIGLLKTVSQLPPDSVIGLLDVVDGEEDDQKEG